MSHTPSDTELVLLKTLWTEQTLSAREIHDRCADQLKWSFSSTRTTLKRMERKALVSTSTVHGVKVYQAKPSKVSVMASLMRDFMRRVVELEGPLPVSAFHDSKLLTEAELTELEKILKRPDGDDD